MKKHESTSKGQSVMPDLLKTIHGISKLTLIGKLDKTLNSIAEGTKDTLRCDAVTLYAYEERRKKLSNVPANIGLYHPDRVKRFEEVTPKSIVHKMLEKSDIQVIKDVLTDDNFSYTRFAHEEEIKSVIVIPLLANSHKVGVMFVNYRSHHDFMQDEFDNVKLFAAQAAIAIYNAQLYEQAQEENIALGLAEQRAHALTLLYEVGTKIIENMQNMEKTLEKIVSGANSLTKTDTGIIYLFDKNEEITAAVSSPEDYREQHPRPRMKKKDGLTRTVIESRKPLWIDDIEKDERVNPDLFEKYGYRSMIALPLILLDSVIGVLFIHAKKYHKFEEDISILEALTSQASITVRSAQIFEQAQAELEVQKRLRKDLNDLEHDLGRTLHTYSSTLIIVQSAIRPAILALGPDPFRLGQMPPVDMIENELEKLRTNLNQSLAKLVSERESNIGRQAFSAGEWDELDGLLKKLSELSDVKTLEFRVPILRAIARTTIEVCEKIEHGHISRELVRETMRRAQNTERVACIIALRHAQDATTDMDYEVRSLRERVVTGAEQDRMHKIYYIWDLVKNAANNFIEFANHKRVELDLVNRTQNAQVRVIRYEIVRAVGNLIHNAIKYSWAKPYTERSWVDIIVEQKARDVYITIENYGVPILPDEMESVFQHGYRGRCSSDRGRPGTGIGLSDARTITWQFGGDLTIKSIPASEPYDQPLQNTPHLTTVEMRLPIC